MTESALSLKIIEPISATVSRADEPVGAGFLAHARRVLRNRTFSEDERIEAERNVCNVEVADDGYESEEESPEILSHDPKDWKNVDQYAVLGLSRLRWRATDEQIKIAHRHKVMKHHPDKKAAGGKGDEDGFFKLIQRAVEVLSDPAKRRQWDSVDPKANVAPPKKQTKGDFFERWSKVFEAEGRFSIKQPVPSLGNMESTKQEVDDFYSFWYRFESWRSFEWLDDDVPDDSANRDNKRHIEKKNKAARAKLKKEDNSRLTKLVDIALSEDPRIRLFKEAAKKAKANKKAGAAGAAPSGETTSADATAAASTANAAAPKAPITEEDKAAAKKAKEAAKNAKKKNKRAIRNCISEAKFFDDAENKAQMEADVDRLIEALNDVQLADTAKAVGSSDPAIVKTALTEAFKSTTVTPKYFI